VFELGFHLLASTLLPRDVRQHHRRLDRGLAIPRSQQLRARPRQLGFALLVLQVEDTPVPEQNMGIVRRERDRLAVIGFRLGKCVQGQCALAGVAQGAHGRFRVNILARRLRELEGVDVVVRDHLGVILGTTERLDPLGRM
jgi:hypothetical protein